MSIGLSRASGRSGSRGSGSSTAPPAKLPDYTNWSRSGGSARLRPGRFRPLLQLAVELEVDLLVEEAQQPLDAAGFRQRIGVVPDQILDPPGGVVTSRPLVRTAGDFVARRQLGDHVLRRQVPTRREAGLK